MLLESLEIPATDSRNCSDQVPRRVNAEFKTLGGVLFNFSSENKNEWKTTAQKST